MWTQMPQQQHQAFADDETQINCIPGSTGGGGVVVVNDGSVTSANINAAYFNVAQTGGKLKTKTAIADFIRAQESKGGTHAQRGVVLIQHGSGPPVLRKLQVAADSDTFNVS